MNEEPSSSDDVSSNLFNTNSNDQKIYQMTDKGEENLDVALESFNILSNAFSPKVQAISSNLSIINTERKKIYKGMQWAKIEIKRKGIKENWNDEVKEEVNKNYKMIYPFLHRSNSPNIFENGKDDIDDDKTYELMKKDKELEKISEFADDLVNILGSISILLPKHAGLAIAIGTAFYNKYRKLCDDLKAGKENLRIHGRDWNEDEKCAANIHYKNFMKHLHRSDSPDVFEVDYKKLSLNKGYDDFMKEKDRMYKYIQNKNDDDEDDQEFGK